jgi:hypothetical protein
MAEKKPKPPTLYIEIDDQLAADIEEELSRRTRRGQRITKKGLILEYVLAGLRGGVPAKQPAPEQVAEQPRQPARGKKTAAAVEPEQPAEVPVQSVETQEPEQQPEARKLTLSEQWAKRDRRAKTLVRETSPAYAVG